MVFIFIAKSTYDNDFALDEQLLDGGIGTYNWKRLSVEFTAPPEANSARVFTKLEGTGTAWFDDIHIVCLSEVELNATIKPIQTMTLKAEGGKSTWHKDSYGDIRVPIKIINFGNKPLKNLPVYVDMEQMLSRLHDRISESAFIQLVDKRSEKQHLRLKNALFFDGHISASTVKTAYAYFDAGESQSTNTAQSDYMDWVNDKRNLIKNPNIEQGETHWNRLLSDTLPENVIQDLFTEELTGDGSFWIQVPLQKKTEEIGWNQEISIKPGTTYMFSSMVKCALVTSGSVSIKIKFQTTDGKTLTESANSNTIRGTTDWKIISGFFKAPDEASVAHLQLALDTPGSVWYDGVMMMEVIEGIVSTLVFDQRKAEEVDEFTAWPVNPIVKVFYEDLPPEQINPARISAARNETEPLQLALRSPRAYHQLRAEIIPPKNPEGQQLDQVSLSVVGYVPINYPTNYYRTEAPSWHLKYPTGDIGSDGWTGFWPDPLLPIDTFDLPANTTQPIWIEVTIPEGAASGDYTGQIILYQKDVPVKEIPWTVHVWNFSIPNEPQFGATYDFRFPDHLRDPGPDLFRNDLNKNEFRDMYWSFMAKHKINGGEILPPPVFQYANGKVHADFTEYDKAASIYFDELKLPFVYAPSDFFYLFDWSKPPGIKFNEPPYPGEYPYENADRGELRPEYKQAFQAVLSSYWEHMKEKGWADKILLYIADEPYQDENTPVDIGAQMKALSSMIHEVDEDIPIYTSTWWYHPEWADYIDVWGLTAFGVAWGKQPVPPEDLRHVVSSGDRLWFTTDGQMCIETPYLAVERLLPLYAYKYGAEAYEFWGVNWFTFNPYEFGWQSYIFQSQAPGEAFWIRYPNGDGYIIYPGKPIGHDGLVASIRLKQVREGVTDYAYLTILDQLIQKAHADGQNVEAAREALNQALEIAELPHDEFNSDPIEVQIFNGRYSTRLLKNPDRVLNVREEIAVQIENLTEK